MSNVRSKICGITRIEDALAAADAGADAIGLVFYAKSPRAVDVHQARAIIAALPPFVTTVGLFVNASRCELNEILEAVPLDLLQFHGDETPSDCVGFNRPYIKALRVRPGDDLEAACQHYAGAIARRARSAARNGSSALAGRCLAWGALVSLHRLRPGHDAGAGPWAASADGLGAPAGARIQGLHSRHCAVWRLAAHA